MGLSHISSPDECRSQPARREDRVAFNTVPVEYLWVILIRTIDTWWILQYLDKERWSQWHLFSIINMHVGVVPRKTSSNIISMPGTKY
jgi:hypothetical protein